MFAYAIKVFALGGITTYAVGYYLLETRGLWAAYLEKVVG